MSAAAVPTAAPAKAAAGQSDYAVELRNVVKRFGKTEIIRGASLAVRPGERVAVIGPNGAGKSTLFNLVTGVLEPTGGEVLVAGRRVDGLPPRAVAALGVARTFQHVRLRPTMTCLENVALGAWLRGRAGLLAGAIGAARDEEARCLREAQSQLDRVGLGALAEAPAGSLALGQQRILEIARALAADPALLMLDEPAAGLRLQEKHALAALLRSLRGQGVTVLVVEHDMDFVMNLVDRIVVLQFGQKIAEGPPDAIRRDPRVVEAYLGGLDD